MGLLRGAGAVSTARSGFAAVTLAGGAFGRVIVCFAGDAVPCGLCKTAPGLTVYGGARLLAAIMSRFGTR